MRHLVYPTLVGTTILFSSLVLGFAAHFQALASRQGHGSQAFTTSFTIVWSSVALLNACVRAYAVSRALAAIPQYRMPKSDGFASIVDFFLLIYGFLLPLAVAKGRAEGDIGVAVRCSPHPEEGDETSDQLCMKWAVWLASVTLLGINLAANKLIIWMRFGDDFYDWARSLGYRGENVGLAQLESLPTSPLLPAADIDLPPPELEMIYDTPAAGPNTIVEYDKSFEGPDQASSSPTLEDRGTRSRTSSVDRPTLDIFTVQPLLATTSTIVAVEERNTQVSRSLRALLQGDRHLPARKLPKVGAEVDRTGRMP